MTAVRIHPDARALGDAVADTLMPDIVAAAAQGRPYLLGCPGGRSPRPVYHALGRRLAASPVDLSRFVVVMMDEYLVGPPGRLSACDPDAHFSCRGFAAREIVAVLNAGLPPECRVGPGNVWMPDPRDPPAYDGRIAAAGGIDHFLLASGAGDGHVAFNPPGSRRDSRTRIVELAQTTRRDNMATFPEFATLDAVPRHGVSVGIETIAGLARAATMLLIGEGKRTAFARIAAARDYEPDWPATVIAVCRDAGVAADAAAAGEVP